MNTAKPYILIAVLFLIALGIYIISSRTAKNKGSDQAVSVTPRTLPSPNQKNPVSRSEYLSREEKSKQYQLAKEITTPDGFINTDDKPIILNDLIGKKVILLDFWTYSCINCQRTTPYLNSWYQKYKDDGLVIVGVHTPEFEFEKIYANVKAAVDKFEIKFPVVLDNDYSTWNAYNNRYWPRKYLIDIDGYIVYDHIGEGAYEETEKKIQELLEERNKVLGMNEEVTKDISLPEDVDHTSATDKRSPEIYFGASRNISLGNGKINTIGLQTLAEPKNIKTDTLYLVGDWNIQEEYAQNQKAGAKIIFGYQAKNVYFVSGSEKPVKIKIIKDGKAIGEQTISPHSLYTLIQDDMYGEHILEIIIENPGLKAYTFTFG